MKAESEIEDHVSVNVAAQPHTSRSDSQSTSRHAAHIALILIAIIAMFWRVFFLGETLIDVATLNNQLPWGYHAAQTDYAYNRRDLTDTYVTREYFVAAAYRDGEFPLWNPYTMAGHPIYADGVTRTLSPFLLFYKFFDVAIGYSLARITELMLAAMFMYLFLVAIGLRGYGALIGSLVFSFSSHSMLHLTGLGWWGGFLWMPLILLFVDRAITRRSYVQAMLAGVCLGAQFFCGYLPNQIYYVGAVVLYCLFFAFVKRGGEATRRSAGPVLAMMLITLAIGLILSATQWVPSLELLSYSNRKIVGAELGYVYLPPWYAATLILPNLFGAAYDAKALTLFTGLGVSHDHILYLSVAALLPLGFSLLWLRSTKKSKSVDAEVNTRLKPELHALRERMVFFVILAVISLVVMMAAPLYVPITRFIPVLQFIRVAVRAGVLFLFAAVVLVAFGTDLLFASSRELLRRYSRLFRRAVDVIGGLVLLAVIAAYAIKLFGLAVDENQRGPLAFIRRTALLLSIQFTPPGASILVPLGLLMLLAFLLWSFAEQRVASRSFLVCLIGLLVVDLFWASGQFNPTFDRSRVFPNTEMTSLIQSLPPGRVLVVPSDLETNRRVSSDAPEKIIAPPNTLLPYQISTVSGKNQQFPRWYREYASLIEPQQNLSHVVFDQYRSPFFDLLNVRYVMTHESAAPLDGYELRSSCEGVSLYENKSAMQRAFFAKSATAVNTPAESLAVMRDPSFDPRNQTVVEATGVVQPEFTGGGSAAIVEDKRNCVVIETDNDREGLLVLSDNFYPGWRAAIDGAPTAIVRANHTMRAVNVPPGRHVVSFAFMPAAFFNSMYASLAGAVLVLATLTGSALKRRRE